MTGYYRKFSSLLRLNQPSLSASSLAIVLEPPSFKSWECNCILLHSGQPFHKREKEGSGVMPIRELFQRFAITRCVQNRTRNDSGYLGSG